jgi:hypothetical protein
LVCLRNNWGLWAKRALAKRFHVSTGFFFALKEASGAQRTRTPFRRADLVNVRFTPESGHVQCN